MKTILTQALPFSYYFTQSARSTRTRPARATPSATCAAPATPLRAPGRRRRRPASVRVRDIGITNRASVPLTVAMGVSWGGRQRAPRAPTARALATTAQVLMRCTSVAICQGVGRSPAWASAFADASPRSVPCEHVQLGRRSGGLHQLPRWLLRQHDWQHGRLCVHQYVQPRHRLHCHAGTDAASRLNGALGCARNSVPGWHL